MEFVRTPDERFESLPDYSFEPHYLVVPGPEDSQLRIHYVDEGPGDAETVLLMHGEPITRGGETVFQKQVPGAKNQPHTTIQGGRHFLQEDCGEELAEVVVNFIHNS